MADNGQDSTTPSIGVNEDMWRKALEARRQNNNSTSPALPSQTVNNAPSPTDPDEMYPPPRDAPNTERAPFDESSSVLLCGSNAPPLKNIEPLPPIGPVFFFRVLVDNQVVHERPDSESSKVGVREKGEIVRVIDFNGAWLRLACETEAQVEEKWQGWMISESIDDTLLEEIEDPLEHEKEYTKNLFKRIWKVNDHVRVRITEKTQRAEQYLRLGRVPPGKRDTLPEGLRCMNAYWGIEARYVKLGPGEEYWPQGCLTHSERTLQAGWEQPKEECRAGHWRVFAARPFGANELVEVCPLVKVDALESMFACMQLRMNCVETPADEDAQFTGKTGKIQVHLPLGYGMLYQQSIELWDVQVNWTPVTNYNCKMLPHDGHMYIYTTRKVQADEELILNYCRNFRNDQGEAIDFTGFTPYWCREKAPENFAKALVTPSGPRKVRPVPGQVKFGKSKLHGRGVFADASFKRHEIIELCPCFVLDRNGVDCMRDYCFHIPAVKVKVEDRELVKREERYVLPLGYGSMYNHMEAGKGENVTWYYDETTQCMAFVAAPTTEDSNEIERNEELCFSYGEAYWDTPSRRYQRPGFIAERIDAFAEREKKTLVRDDIGQPRYV